MLEEGDFMATDWSKDGQGDSLVYYDWKRVHDVLDGEYEKWVDWKKGMISLRLTALFIWVDIEISSQCPVI
jgi:hypothetical protein